MKKSPLQTARDAIVANELPRALAQLLEAWRAKPAAALADVIEQIGARAAEGIAPPSGKTAGAKNAAWDDLARSGDPVVRHVLLATLLDTKGSPATLERLELLAAHPPDPRFAAALCAIMETPPYNTTNTRTKPFWARLFELLATAGDPRVAERVRGFTAAWDAGDAMTKLERPMFERKFAKARPAIDAAYARGVPALSADEAALVAAITGARVAQAPAPDTSAQRLDGELLAAVYAAPDDDAPRLVYADSLSAQNDPRGELIVLQIARAQNTATAAQLARERDLLAEYTDRFILPLPINKSTVTFVRGFVDTCEARGPLGDEPAWATVRDTTNVPASDRCATTCLRVLRLKGHEPIFQLAKLTRPLEVEELTWYGPVDADYGPPSRAQIVTAFGKIRVLPKLRRLATDPHMYDAQPKHLSFAWSSEYLPALVELATVIDLHNLGVWLAALGKTQLLRIELATGRAKGWTIQLARPTAKAKWGELVLTAPRARGEAAAQIPAQRLAHVRALQEAGIEIPEPISRAARA